MKKRRRKRAEAEAAARARGARAVQAAFLRGFVATALLAAVDNGGGRGAAGGLSTEALRRALRTGVAVAAGTFVAGALQERRLVPAAVVLAAGAAGLALVGQGPASVGDAASEEARGGGEEAQEVRQA